MVLGSRRPSVNQVAMMNDILRYAGTALGEAAASVRSADFWTSYSQITEAPMRHVGRLTLRTGSVGGDAILTVDIRP